MFNKRDGKAWVESMTLAFVVACIAAMLHPILRADFAMVDDHEIVRMLGSDHRIQLSEVLPLMREWAFEDNGRFRPGYYALRILEAFVVGPRAGLWYANRLALALLSALALYGGLRVLLPPVYAGVVTLLFFSGGQNEVWTGTGPAEGYGVPLTLLGLAWIAVQLRHRDWLPMALWPGFALLLLAGFIKESFIPIFPATLVFVYFVLPFVSLSTFVARRPFNRADALVAVLLIVGFGAQVGLTVMMLKTYQHPYGVETSMTSFLVWIKPMLLAYSGDRGWRRGDTRCRVGGGSVLLQRWRVRTAPGQAHLVEQRQLGRVRARSGGNRRQRPGREMPRRGEADVVPTQRLRRAGVPPRDRGDASSRCQVTVWLARLTMYRTSTTSTLNPGGWWSSHWNNAHTDQNVYVVGVLPAQVGSGTCAIEVTTAFRTQPDGENEFAYRATNVGDVACSAQLLHVKLPVNDTRSLGSRPPGNGWFLTTGRPPAGTKVQVAGAAPAKVATGTCQYTPDQEVGYGGLASLWVVLRNTGTVACGLTATFAWL